MAYEGPLKGPNGVNVAELLRVADLIEHSQTYDQFNWYHDCGTPSCIAGHVVGKVSAVCLPVSAEDMTNKAQLILSLSDDQAHELFRACPEIGEDVVSPTNIHAAACLRKLALTGEVDWLGTKPVEG